ncbi:hypothetical protein [Spirosoma endbachense]|uniref:DUF4404 family protein n=1 Tax=Spirosoma endbachense TaxID=2666025 RepID=A0A6P1W1L6_9BACT|nr:hypothetical protein [Spirosoma endbachense]QHV97879.1 hypothetical protein GJR95_23995 [Spirosoma endbachense]
MNPDDQTLEEHKQQMLQFRQTMKEQHGEEFDTMLNSYKETLQTILNQMPGMTAVELADQMVDQLDADTALDDDERELWKGLIVIAALEMDNLID